MTKAAQGARNITMIIFSYIQLKKYQDLNALGLNFDERLLHTTKKRNNQYCLGSGINQAQNYFFAKENTSSISWDRLDV